MTAMLVAFAVLFLSVGGASCGGAAPPGGAQSAEQVASANLREHVKGLLASRAAQAAEAKRRRRPWWRDCADAEWAKAGCCPDPADQVWWDRHTLSAAYAGANFLQMDGFTTKLHRGEPVTVLALGSSVSADHGGGFHRSLEHLASQVATVPDFYLTDNSKSDFQAGWLKSVMVALNTTFPHRDHLLVNTAWSGRDLMNYAASPCLENYLPRSVDLVIIENLSHHPSHDDPLDTVLMRIYAHLRAQGQCKRPGVILFNTRKVTERVDKGRWRSNATLERALCEGGEEAHIIGPGLFDGTGSGRGTEDDNEVAARYHGIAVLSLRDFFWNVFRSGLPARHGLSECQLLRTVLSDQYHPSIGWNQPGERLFSDLVLNYLGDAEYSRHLRAAGSPEDERHEDHRRAEECNPGDWQPMPPLHESEKHPAMARRCYGVTDEFIERINYGRDVLEGKLYFEQGLQKLGYRQHDSSSHAAFNILANHGWNFTAYNVHGAVKRIRPGWVAEAAGARLEVQVDAAFADARQVVAVVEYLQSYEHMGTAQFSCVSGCACEAATVSAHSPQLRESVPRTVALALQEPSHACVLAVQVLEDTTSGEHKYKLTRIMLEAPLY